MSPRRPPHWFLGVSGAKRTYGRRMMFGHVARDEEASRGGYPPSRLRAPGTRHGRPHRCIQMEQNFIPALSRVPGYIASVQEMEFYQADTIEAPTVDYPMTMSDSA